MNGKPLVAWSIEHCLNTPSIQETVVSTDSLDIRDVAIANGAQTPFIRPVNLSSDTASSIDVLLHCLDWYKEQDKCFDVVVMIEPTSPLREVSDIEKGLEKLFKIGEGSVVSVCESEGGHPSFLMFNLLNRNLLHSQESIRLTFEDKTLTLFIFSMELFTHLS